MESPYQISLELSLPQGEQPQLTQPFSTGDPVASSGPAPTAPHPSHAVPRARRSAPAEPHRLYTCTAAGPGPAQSRDRGVPPALGAPHSHPLPPRARRPSPAAASGGIAREGKRRPGPPAPKGHFNNLSLPSASRAARRTQNGSCLYIKAPGGRGGGETRGDLPFPIPPPPSPLLAAPLRRPHLPGAATRSARTGRPAAGLPSRGPPAARPLYAPLGRSAAPRQQPRRAGALPSRGARGHGNSRTVPKAASP